VGEQQAVVVAVEEAIVVGLVGPDFAGMGEAAVVTIATVASASCGARMSSTGGKLIPAGSGRHGHAGRNRRSSSSSRR
jgi:hypothetical protein